MRNQFISLCTIEVPVRDVMHCGTNEPRLDKAVVNLAHCIWSVERLFISLV